MYQKLPQTMAYFSVGKLFLSIQKAQQMFETRLDATQFWCRTKCLFHTQFQFPNISGFQQPIRKSNQAIALVIKRPSATCANCYRYIFVRRWEAKKNESTGIKPTPIRSDTPRHGVVPLTLPAFA